MARVPSVDDDGDGNSRLLGELIGLNKGMQAQLSDIRREADARAQSQKGDQLRTEEQVRAIRDTQFTNSMTMQNNATMLQSGVDQLAAKLRTMEDRVTSIDNKVEAFKGPLEKAIAWQARVAGGLIVVSTVAGVLWWVIQQFLSTWFKRGG